MMMISVNMMIEIKIKTNLLVTARTRLAAILNILDQIVLIDKNYEMTIPCKYEMI